MNPKLVALSAAGSIVVLGAAVGGGWAIVNHQVGEAEAKISRAVTFGIDPGKAIPARPFGDRFLARQSVRSALVVMGTRYEYGVGVDEDLAAAVASFRAAADRGDPIGELMLGRLYDENNTSPDQRHVVTKFVTDPGDSTDPVGREDSYLTDDSGERFLTLDDATALNWYRKAAAKGNTAAMDLLGDYYIHNERADDAYADKAAEWYAKSAKLGDAAGEYHLGESYIRDDESQDEDAGLAWLEKSSAQGYGQDIYDPALSLGMEYEQGPPFTRSQVQAAKWYKVSADRGNQFAARNLGLMYVKGVGVERDYVAAYRLLKAAAAKEAPNAVEALNALEAQMTPQQLAAAQAPATGH